MLHPFASALHASLTKRKVTKISAVIFLVTIGSRTIADASNTRCSGSVAIFGENMPYNTVDEGHAIQSIEIISSRSSIMGWLYTDVNYTKWIAIKTEAKASEPVLRSILDAFGAAKPSATLNTVRDFAFPRTNNPDFSKLPIDEPITIAACARNPLT